MIAALALLLQAGSAAAPAEVPAAFADLPDVTVGWYDVAGRDPGAIRAAMNRLRPTDANDGTRVDALTSFAIGSSWRTRGDGSCDLSAARATLRATVLLPRLIGDVAPAVRDRWNRYRTALEGHEAEHVRRVHARLPELEAALRGATCATVRAAGQAVLASIHADGIAFDAATDHGRREGATFP